MKTALVTVNGDVFSDVIIQDQGLAGIFDVIVNSADHGCSDKLRLWPIAFAALGADISYADALLIEDGERNPARFRLQGGLAHQYCGDETLRTWLHSADFGVHGAVFLD